MGTIHRVFVTGATGFVGRAVVHALRAEGFMVRCLVRRGSEPDLRGLEAIERVEGDVLVRQSLDEGMAGCEAVIHLVGIIREHPGRGVTFERVHVDGTVNVLAAATVAGTRRFVHMSALGASSAARSRHDQSKWIAEEAVRSSALPWTIFRPSLIYGPGDHVVSMLARMMEHFPFVPIIGDGRQRLQPVPVEQVADAFARCLQKPETVKHAYEVGGPETVSLAKLVDQIGEALGRGRVTKISVPVGIARPIARLLHPLHSFPLTPDQIVMLMEDNVCDPAPFFTTFGLTPISLKAGLARMLG